MPSTPSTGLLVWTAVPAAGGGWARSILEGVDEGYEVLRAQAVGRERIDRGGGIWVAQRHAANDLLIGRDAEPPLQHVIEDEEGGLRAGLQSELPRRHHDRLQEHAIVEPGAQFQVTVDGKDQTDGRIEEQEIAPMLGVHFVLVGATDAQS